MTINELYTCDLDWYGKFPVQITNTNNPEDTHTYKYYANIPDELKDRKIHMFTRVSDRYIIFTE